MKTKKATGARKSTGTRNVKSLANKAVSPSSGNGSGGGNVRRAEPESQGRKDIMLEEYFVGLLKDIYGAEKQLTKELLKMAKKATSEDLRDAFFNHQSETEGHVKRLEQCFEILGKKAVAKKCEAMAGLIAETKAVIEETEDGTYTRDVALIVSAQKVEHYEIASYGSLVQIATTLGHYNVSELLEEILEQEKNSDVLLSDIATHGINDEAAVEEEAAEEE
jgi:ferritin-like metal-binding protein YciE